MTSRAVRARVLESLLKRSRPQAGTDTEESATRIEGSRFGRERVLPFDHDAGSGLEAAGMTESKNPSAGRPPVGGFASIDGNQIFVHKSGDGGPPVVFLAGASAVGLDYWLILDQIAPFVTGVVYDRGGTGFSDPLPLPRTCTAIATELHDLLQARGVQGPYILVPHSLGGYYAHRFCQLYPDEVAGLVWLDAAYRDWDQYFPHPLQLAQAEKIGADPEQMLQLRPTMLEWADEMYAAFPQTLRQALIDVHLSDHGIRAGAVERGTQAAPAAEVQDGPDLPDVATIALTIVGSDAPQEELVSAEESQLTRDLNQGKIRMDAAMINRLSFGEQRIIDDVGHSEVIFSRPEVVVQAIQDVVDRLSDSASR